MRILVLNADYPRFLAWFYRRQAELESASYATQPVCLASPISIRKLRRVGHLAPRLTSTIHGSRPLGHANTALRSKPPSPRRYRPQGAPNQVRIAPDAPIRRLGEP